MDNLFALTPLAVACAPLVLGLVQVLKQVGLPSRFAPLLSIGLGIALVSLGYPGNTFISGAIVIQGIIVGLMASGIWAGSKALFTPSEPPPFVGTAN